MGDQGLDVNLLCGREPAALDEHGRERGGATTLDEGRARPRKLLGVDEVTLEREHAKAQVVLIFSHGPQAGHGKARAHRGPR